MPAVPADCAPEPSGRSDAPIAVVGIGADGWSGLSEAARAALEGAAVILGSARQLASLTPLAAESSATPRLTAQLVAWPSPLLPALADLVEQHRAAGLAVLASGDPMFYGIGATLARRYGPDALTVIPHVSSVTLACARLGWPLEDVEVLSVVGRPAATMIAALQPGQRRLVLVESSEDVAMIAALLTEHGYGPSALTLLSDLGGQAEIARHGSAQQWQSAERRSLAVLAIELELAPGRVPLSRTPGLSDEAFSHDGQLTKREVRAVTLAALAPNPGELLWDVGAGSGSVGIEWMRTHSSCRAIALEPRSDRLARITANAAGLGVPTLRVIAGRAPAAFAEMAAFGPPDAVFLGGAVSVDGVLDAALAALPVGGRLVANGVTLETESVLGQAYARLGGELSRLAVQRASPVGDFTGWRPAMTVTQWHYRKERL